MAAKQTWPDQSNWLQNIAHNLQVHQTKLQDVNNLMQSLTAMWAGVEQSVIDADISMPAFEPHEDIQNIHCDNISQKRLN